MERPHNKSLVPPIIKMLSGFLEITSLKNLLNIEGVVSPLIPLLITFSEVFLEILYTQPSFLCTPYPKVRLSPIKINIKYLLLK